jgi:predicted Zn finger-like uncharacterized protein
MDISFNCPHCDQRLAVDESGAGMTVNCPTCNERINIPRGTAPQPPPLSIPTTQRQPQSASGRTGYVDSYLMPGENVVYRTRLHWAVLFPSLAALVLAVWLLFTRNEVLVPTGGLLLVLFAFPLIITALIARATSEFAVTNKRVLIKIGWGTGKGNQDSSTGLSATHRPVYNCPHTSPSRERP